MRLAVLIDAENVPPSALDRVMTEAGRLGRIETRRAYGKWQEQRLAAWDGPLRHHAFRKVSLDTCAAGRNAADIALAIDAMELLHEGRHDGFCIVSSDSDFAPLARRLRERSCRVFGFGEAKAPEAWRKECDRFVLISAPPSPALVDPVIGERILQAVKAVAVDGVAPLTAIGHELHKGDVPPIPGKLSTLIGQHLKLKVEKRGKEDVVRLQAIAAE
jgi:hypothetical protein